MFRRRFAALLSLPACLAAAAASLAATPGDGPLQVWATTADRHLALTPLSADAAIDDAAPTVRIAIDPADRRQRIDGFGAAITDSSA